MKAVRASFRGPSRSRPTEPLPPSAFSADSSPGGLTDGVFIFEAVSSEDSKTIQGYDAIVVEQWTVLEVSVGLAAVLLLFGH